MSCPVLTVDGPSGSGKGTISRDLAKRLGWHYLNSGALYRCVGLKAISDGVNWEDVDALAELARRLDVAFPATSGDEIVVLDGQDVTAQLGTETTGEAASIVAALGPVRQALLQRQRSFASAPGLVADGRDMGSVVFPGADTKVFLTASAEERARRRHKQLKDKGIDVSLPALSRDIAERDQRDAARSVSPLKAAADARVLDSTNLSPDEVVARILEWMQHAGTLPRN